MEDHRGLVKRPWLAVILSRLLPGLGQFYAGAWLSGLVFLVVWVLLSVGAILPMMPDASMLHGLIPGALCICVAIAGLFHAHYCARRRNAPSAEQVRKQGKKPYLAVFLTQLLPGIGHLYLRRWTLGVLLVAVSLGFLFGRGYNRHTSWGSLLFLLEPVYTGLICFLAFLAASMGRRQGKKFAVGICLLIVATKLLPAGSALLVRRYAVEAFIHPTESMTPTIERGDRILTWKLWYQPGRGDVIIFRYHPDERSQYFVKRLAALPGETIEIREGGVHINGLRLTDGVWGRLRHVNMHHPRAEFAGEGNPFVVPPESVFVLGDNSERSLDSRFFGPVPVSDIIGKAYKRYWPIGRAGRIE